MFNLCFRCSYHFCLFKKIHYKILFKTIGPATLNASYSVFTYNLTPQKWQTWAESSLAARDLRGLSFFRHALDSSQMTSLFLSLVFKRTHLNKPQRDTTPDGTTRMSSIHVVLMGDRLCCASCYSAPAARVYPSGPLGWANQLEQILVQEVRVCSAQKHECDAWWDWALTNERAWYVSLSQRLWLMQGGGGWENVILFNDNNTNGFLYRAQVCHAVTLMTLQHDYPWSLCLKSFLQTSQLPREYTALCNKWATRLNQTQEPSLPSHVSIYPWVERSN